MMARKTSTISPTMERARPRFEHWRRTRPPSSPIPEARWSAAVKVASEHGVNPTAQALRLNYNALQERVKAEGAARSRQPPIAFRERAPWLPAGSSPCTIELENAQGAQRKIPLPRRETADRVALSRSWWREGR